jgi:hypothetical protein
VVVASMLVFQRGSLPGPRPLRLASPRVSSQITYVREVLEESGIILLYWTSRTKRSVDENVPGILEGTRTGGAF